VVHTPQVTVRLSFYTAQLFCSLASLDPSLFGLWHRTDRRWFYSLLKTNYCQVSGRFGKIQSNTKHAFALNWFAEISTNKWAAAFAAGRCPCTVVADNKTVLGHFSFRDVTTASNPGKLLLRGF
jgi:hypothetical protein